MSPMRSAGAPPKRTWMRFVQINPWQRLDDRKQPYFVRDPRKLLPLLRPYHADEMEAYPVGRLVNDPANDVPGCVRRVG